MYRIILLIIKFSYLCINQVQRRINRCKSAVDNSVYFDLDRFING